MFLVWTLSSLILSYALGFPFLNSTSSGSHMETFLNVTEGNFTEYNKSNQTSHVFVRPNLSIWLCCLLYRCASSIELFLFVSFFLFRQSFDIPKW
uniref:Uncharacterized protein n=1 Tax=Sinocyclocheilus rhinocerous TaxID=307959 RepID=A0A673M3N1_9TELE